MQGCVHVGARSRRDPRPPRAHLAAGRHRAGTRCAALSAPAAAARLPPASPREHGGGASRSAAGAAPPSGGWGHGRGRSRLCQGPGSAQIPARLRSRHGASPSWAGAEGEAGLGTAGEGDVGWPQHLSPQCSPQPSLKGPHLAGVAGFWPQFEQSVAEHSPR